ncbi:deoxyribodipyrimidine photo-lyase [Prosthecochloris sp. N3]|uniref:Deoxyribodipyrimidine photo-lyase n=1 Tax=Prosthecochloris ethylica TaxID=2743976 RepID=A0ABR9XTY9_9CHLB|nr:deoxyribodipyrimidine photo-lyase [Prosthecochloris ethylica]MBF0587290.1 deoxyribodipyrimidine photo-lyase [Prosthecochloris ethylica]MBF0637488.1 deoxyribodipyrimidine photo-lyase [Prosthecochloris ethylica]NUK48098.1 deoxyribodipyrimidine photo-lyase [Prosthecochloris ethylica]
MDETCTICWFRNDLRLQDNPALTAAAAEGRVLPLYIHQHEQLARATGAAGRWWLHHALSNLNDALGRNLLISSGDPEAIILRLARLTGARSVVCNRVYDPEGVEQDKRIFEKLSNNGISVRTFNASLLQEPWLVLKPDGTPYRIFTPFYRNGYAGRKQSYTPLPVPPRLQTFSPEHESLPLERLGLLPDHPWHRKFTPIWQPGEEGAHKRLKEFVQHGLQGYSKGRDFPAEPHVSRLSPSLRFGEISPRQIWHALKNLPESEDRERFLTEIGWREFAYSLLFYNPSMPERPLQHKYSAFAWNDDMHALKLWQQGRTGYPLVDAGMRELWQTGYMHNRLRMITGSFLVKNLRIHWKHGRDWFHDCLLDADAANNNAGWQWVAGCGTDAAPYFRIFNPVTQAKRFDPAGTYTRRYIPELSRLPDRYLFEPWKAPPDILRDAGITPGVTYPEPIVDLQASRQAALQALKQLED